MLSIVKRLFENLTKKGHGVNFVVLLLYAVMSALLTYPLILNINSGIIGGITDTYVYLWNNWWIKYSIFTLHSNPFETAYLLFPFIPSLLFHALTFTNSLISIPFNLVFTPVTAFNIQFLAGMTLSGFGAYRLVFYLTQDRYASFLSGVFFAFNSFVFFHIGHYNYATLYFIPFYVLFLFKTIDTAGWKYPIIAGLFLAASIYNDYLLFYGMALVSAVIVGVTLYKAGDKLTVLLKRLSLLVFVFLVLSGPLLIMGLSQYAEKGNVAAKLPQIVYYNPDIRSLFVPSPQNTFFGSNFTGYYEKLSSHGYVIYVGFLLLCLALIGIAKAFSSRGFEKSDNAKVRLFFFASLAFLFISLGPFLFIGSNIFNLDGYSLTFPMPYLLFYFVPFVKAMLIPSRFFIFFLFCLILIASYVLRGIFAGFSPARRAVLCALLTCVIMIEYMSIPFPLIKTDIPDFYYELAEDNSDYTILELPFALGTSYYTVGEVSPTSKMQFFQTVHRKKILNGYVSRVPEEYGQFYISLVGLDYLIDPKIELSRKAIEQNSVKVKKNFSALRIKYILVHPEFYNHAQLKNTLRYLTASFGKEPRLDSGIYVYEIN